MAELPEEGEHDDPPLLLGQQIQFVADHDPVDHSVRRRRLGLGGGDALGCGEVLSNVLLEATMAGLATCTLSHLTELEASRAILRALIGGSDDPQLLIRIGVVPALGDVPPATPRRPLSDVLEIRG